MPKVTPLAADLEKRAALRERAKKLKRLKPGKDVKAEELLQNLELRVRIIEKILGLADVDEGDR